MNPPSTPAGSGGDLLAGLLRIVTGARPGADTRLIKNAYDVAAHWHQGQRRKSGDPYITHPVAVAVILAETGANDATLCAALLHDVLADTSCPPAALGDTFGAEIAGLVTATMALDRVPAGQLAAACADAGAAVALAGDERALLIKVADRLHNMRTLRHLPRATQMHKSRQTLDLVVPLARTLGVDAIGSELHSLASATLRRHGRRPGTASGHMLSALAALLPAPARARWRQEWLAELHRLATRRERLGFVIQITLGFGRLAVTLYREPRRHQD